MPPRALMKSMSMSTMVFMAGSTPPCITPVPSHPVAVAPRWIDQLSSQASKQRYRIERGVSGCHGKAAS